MVNNRKILSLYQDSPPADDQANRKIAGGPLYAKVDILAILGLSDISIQYWTQKCIADIQKLALGPDQVSALIDDVIRNGKFKGSEWCVNKPGGPWAACDAYSYSRKEWSAIAHKELSHDYYIKFAIGKTGKLLLLVSCHLSP